MLRDQLYSVKINNVKTDAILQPNKVIKENELIALNNSNNTHLVKLSWLSSYYIRKIYRFIVIFFTKGSEAVRFLRDSFFTINSKSVYIRVFKPNIGPL